ncbi:MAG: hypothetical protein J5J06_17905 [Phycisphaerae bacterium]|nr:hypothetical protein [Phycisphaerae bacterium]
MADETKQRSGLLLPVGIAGVIGLVFGFLIGLLFVEGRSKDQFVECEAALNSATLKQGEAEAGLKQCTNEKARALDKLQTCTATSARLEEQANRLGECNAQVALLEARVAELEPAQTEQPPPAPDSTSNQLRVLRASVRRSDGIFNDVVLDLEVENNTAVPISKVRFDCVIKSPGRAVPWFEGRFSYEIPGGVEPGELVEWHLTRQFDSEWRTKIPFDERSDFIVEVTVLDLFDAEGKPLIVEDRNR